MMRMIPLNSSQVTGIAYNPDTEVMVAQFNNGEFYQYDLVPREAVVYTLFDPESQGKAFNLHIRSQPYPYRKLAPEETRDFVV